MCNIYIIYTMNTWKISLFQIISRWKLIKKWSNCLLACSLMSIILEWWVTYCWSVQTYTRKTFSTLKPILSTHTCTPLPGGVCWRWEEGLWRTYRGTVLCPHPPTPFLVQHVVVIIDLKETEAEYKIIKHNVISM